MAHVGSPALAKVSCRDAIRQARVTRQKSKGLRALSKVNLKKSEAGSHTVFKRFGRSLDLPISKIDVSSKEGFPYVKFSHWLQYLVKNDEMDKLVGVADLTQMRPILKTFWSRYQEINPEHDIFRLARERRLEIDMVIPVVHHGDEGRGAKKKQIMILSTHGILGKGSKESEKNGEPADLTQAPLKMNYRGNTMLNHFLFAAMPVSYYNETPDAFYALLDAQAQEFRSLFEDGLVVNERRYHVCCLGIKGDAPYLAKSGRFERSFARRPTRPTSKKPASGICHLCLAGREGWTHPVPFEEINSECPRWLITVGIEKPYATPSPFLQVPVTNGVADETFFHYDLFHNFHSGIGKYYISSAICVHLELVQASIEKAFEQITDDFKSWCRREHVSQYHKKLTATLFGVETGFAVCPEGVCLSFGLPNWFGLPNSGL